MKSLRVAAVTGLKLSSAASASRFRAARAMAST
jgi:hypothetical protein